jgi:hypothetical protein
MGCWAFSRFGVQGHHCGKSVTLLSENIESALPDSFPTGLARAIRVGCAKKLLTALEVPLLQLLLCISTSQLGSFLFHIDDSRATWRCSQTAKGTTHYLLPS